MPTALIAGIDMSACARRPSSFAIPLHEAAETGQDAAGDHFERATHRVAGLTRAIDLVDHLLLENRVHAVQRRIGRDGLWLLQTSPRAGRRALTLPMQNTWLTISEPIDESS